MCNIFDDIDSLFGFDLINNSVRTQTPELNMQFFNQLPQIEHQD